MPANENYKNFKSKERERITCKGLGEILQEVSEDQQLSRVYASKPTRHTPAVLNVRVSPIFFFLKKRSLLFIKKEA
jgi:hypothetical protein